MPRRAWIASIGIFLATGCLAWIMTVQRAGGAILPRLEPPGWSITFQPPATFRRGGAVLTNAGPAFRFVSPVSGGAVAVLTVVRVQRDPGDGSLVIAERVYRTFLDPGAGWSSIFGLTDFSKKLGPLSAVELWDPVPRLRGLIVRGAVVDDDAYAVSLAVVEGEISPAIYALFDQTCASIEYRGGTALDE